MKVYDEEKNYPDMLMLNMFVSGVYKAELLSHRKITNNNINN